MAVPWAAGKGGEKEMKRAESLAAELDVIKGYKTGGLLGR